MDETILSTWSGLPAKVEVAGPRIAVTDLMDKTKTERPGVALQTTVVSARARLEPGVSVTLGAKPGSISSIGPYRISAMLGSGGMGRVYLAEQTEPIRRQVAIKLMKTSLASLEAVARFSAERQAMARMSHANVARIFDGGTTEDGHPFFVMEYVPGLPITGYCDKMSMSIEQRLRLFLDVCAGVQHAHLNQILHRDLKPANILVCDIDDQPVVKIIDFGLAKALDHSLVDQASLTGERMVGTPAYMSPEAMGVSPTGPTGIDARTDVYSLGILLYELLVGTGPFQIGNNLAELLRQVGEDEPPRMSRRLSALSAGERQQIAAARQVEQVELPRRLTGDLQWIVHKALAKNPDERYGSAAELGAEIDRYLSHEPVLAGPHTLGYRLGKLVRRHRIAVAAATVAILALVVGIIATSTAMLRARQAEQLARMEARASRQVTDFLVELFEISDPFQTPDQAVDARELLERGAARVHRELGDQPLLRARMMSTLGRVHLQLGLYQQAEPLLDEALALRQDLLGANHRGVAEVLLALGRMYRDTGRPEDALDATERALRIQSRSLAADAPELVSGLHQLGTVHIRRGEYDTAKGVLERARDIAENALPRDSLELAELASALGASHAYRGEFADAEVQYRQALDIYEKSHGPDHPMVAGVVSSLALLAQHDGRFAEQDRLFQRALDIYEQTLGTEHPRVRIVLSNLGLSLLRRGRHEEAREVLERAVALDETSQAHETASGASRLTNLGVAYWKLGLLDEAAPLFQRATTIRERVLGPDHPHRATSLWGLANVYRDQGRYEPAEDLYKQALEIRERVLPAGHVELNEALTEYARLLRILGRDSEAAALETRVETKPDD